MSIIHEALKKVEASNSQQAKPSPRADKKNNLRVYALYLIVAALGFVCANLIFSFFTRPLHKLVKPPPAPKPSLPIPPKELPPEQEKETPPAPLVLNGIFFSGEQGYALINNKIVKEGDEIMGATVVRIALEGVELKTKDSVTKFSSQTK